jgi:uncharacterized protein YlaI
MAEFICQGCGHRTSSPGGGSCNHSASRNHVYIPVSPTGNYICQGCGHRTSSPGGGSCSASGSGYHVYIAN